MTTGKSKKEDKSSNASGQPIEAVKINKWDGCAVKHGIDDAVRSALLERSNCYEHFGLVDGRLFICGLAVGIALLALGWDYQYPFPESRPMLIGCVLSYFVLMGILTLYTQFREKGIFAVAVQQDNNNVKKTWQASSEMKKYDDQYKLILTVRDSKGVREASITKSCAFFIDTNGVIIDHLVTNEVNRLYNSLNSEKKDK